MAEPHEYQSNLVKDLPEVQAKKEAWKDTFVPMALRGKFKRSSASGTSPEDQQQPATGQNSKVDKNLEDNQPLNEAL